MNLGVKFSLFALALVAGAACGEASSSDAPATGGRGGTGAAGGGGGAHAGEGAGEAYGAGADSDSVSEGGVGSGGDDVGPAAGGRDDGGSSEGGESGAGTESGGGAGGTHDGSSGAGGASSLPLNVLIMFDRSASMRECLDGEVLATTCGTGATRWERAAASLRTFVEDPAAAGLGVALRFFPHDVPRAGCTNDMCDITACSTPLVELGRLTADPAPTDSQEGALVQAISASAPTVTPSSGTPTGPALAGALNWATSYQATHPEQTTVVVLVTDGEPNGCEEDWDEIIALSAEALTDADVRTFAVGLTGASDAGPSTAALNDLAAAGGTDRAYIVADDASANLDLLAALNAIRNRI